MFRNWGCVFVNVCVCAEFALYVRVCIRSGLLGGVGEEKEESGHESGLLGVVFCQQSLIFSFR